MLHLHRVEHRDVLALANLVPGGDFEADYRALHGSEDGARFCAVLFGRSRRGQGGAALPVNEDRQRVDRVNLRAGGVPGGRACRGGGVVLPWRGQLHHILVNKGGVGIGANECRVIDEVAEERDVRREAADPEFAQGAPAASDHLVESCGRVDYQFCEQRIERRGGAVAAAGEGVEADPRPGRGVELFDEPDRWPQRPIGPDLLRVHPELDGVAARRRHPVLRQAQVRKGCAAGDAQLDLHEVDAEHLFGHGVLNLEPRVRFDKGVGAAGTARSVGRYEELERARAAIPVGAGHPHGVGGEPLAKLRVQHRGRGDLHHLLVAALQRTVALPEVRHRAGTVTDDLDFDVARAGHPLFDVEGTVAEGPRGFGLAACVSGVDLGRVRDDAHPPAAAAGDRLDDHFGAAGEGREERPRLLDGDRPGAARNGRHAVLLRDGFGLRLVAEGGQRLRGRADEDQPSLDAAPRELLVLAQEAPPGVDRVAACAEPRGDDLLDVEVGCRARAGEQFSGVGGADMHAGRIVFAIDGDGGNAHFGGRTGHAHGDLAPVRNKQT